MMTSLAVNASVWGEHHSPPGDQKFSPLKRTSSEVRQSTTGGSSA
jgi:hypothetical protein